MIYQCFLLRLDFPGPFHKIMTVSNEKIDYILKQRVWQHSFTTAVTSQNNLIRRIFAWSMRLYMRSWSLLSLVFSKIWLYYKLLKVFKVFFSTYMIKKILTFLHENLR